MPAHGTRGARLSQHDSTAKPLMPPEPILKIFRAELVQCQSVPHHERSGQGSGSLLLWAHPDRGQRKVDSDHLEPARRQEERVLARAAAGVEDGTLVGEADEDRLRAADLPRRSAVPMRSTCAWRSAASAPCAS